MYNIFNQLLHILIYIIISYYYIVTIQNKVAMVEKQAKSHLFTFPPILACDGKKQASAPVRNFLRLQGDFLAGSELRAIFLLITDHLM